MLRPHNISGNVQEECPFYREIAGHYSTNGISVLLTYKRNGYSGIIRNIFLFRNKINRTLTHPKIDDHLHKVHKLHFWSVDTATTSTLKKVFVIRYLTHKYRNVGLNCLNKPAAFSGPASRKRSFSRALTLSILTSNVKWSVSFLSGIHNKWNKGYFPVLFSLN